MYAINLNGMALRAESNSGMGIDATSQSGTAVYADSYTGKGVIGNSHDNMGIDGQSLNSIGVRGASYYSSGVVGETQSTGLYTAGVRGESYASGGHGVIGEADTGPNSYGVWGKSLEGYAGYFSGDVYVGGNLAKSAGSFKIDDPLDPANKYLSHSFVESPDMMNIYNGEVTLDGKGEATVTMPDWFEALNEDFRYQLTAVGGPGPNLYIAQKMAGKRFRIAGGTPGLEVSWQVTGIRHDPYAEKHRIPVEENKPANEQGYYLPPELYGQPAVKQMENARLTTSTGEKRPGK
ncbi:MAG: hypothetical protein ACJ78Q_00725 [Chloroflexia bacterium]